MTTAVFVFDATARSELLNAGEVCESEARPGVNGSDLLNSGEVRESEARPGVNGFVCGADNWLAEPIACSEKLDCTSLLTSPFPQLWPGPNCDQLRNRA